MNKDMEHNKKIKRILRGKAKEYFTKSIIREKFLLFFSNSKNIRDLDEV
jgi:hypothetical protein